MKCPVCGDDTNGSRCLRCGYVFKDISVVDEPDGDEDEPETEFREISPDKVRMSRAGGGGLLDDLLGGFGFGGFGFGGFGGLGGVFDSLFGGIFGYDEPDGYDDDPRNFDDFGERLAPRDVFEEDAVEISDVEFFDEDGKTDGTKGKK